VHDKVVQKFAVSKAESKEMNFFHEVTLSKGDFSCYVENVECIFWY